MSNIKIDEIERVELNLDMTDLIREKNEWNTVGKMENKKVVELAKKFFNKVLLDK